MNQNIGNSKKGFTLMEILFVVLVIALVVSFAMPAIRSVRFDIKNARAKAALKKVAEARRNYYASTRGGDFAFDNVFDMGSAKYYADVSCQNPAASGVPGSASQTITTTYGKFEQLFACGFLDWKDFMDLPYTVHFCDIGTESNFSPCIANNKMYVAAKATSDNAKIVGKKYVSPYYMYIDLDDMTVRDNEE